jgi:hypothetical protein
MFRKSSLAPGAFAVNSFARVRQAHKDKHCENRTAQKRHQVEANQSFVSFVPLW